MPYKPTIKIPEQKTVLVVDDWQMRIDWFRERLEGKHPKVHATYAMTPAKANNILGAHRFDAVFLDHDAIPEFVTFERLDFYDSSFYRAAMILAAQAYDGTVFIHSHNPIGAENMRRLLNDRTEAKVTVIPFGQFELEVQ